MSCPYFRGVLYKRFHCSYKIWFPAPWWSFYKFVLAHLFARPSPGGGYKKAENPVSTVLQPHIGDQGLRMEIGTDQRPDVSDLNMCTHALKEGDAIGGIHMLTVIVQCSLTFNVMYHHRNQTLRLLYSLNA